MKRSPFAAVSFVVLASVPVLGDRAGAQTSCPLHEVPCKQSSSETATSMRWEGEDFSLPSDVGTNYASTAASAGRAQLWWSNWSSNYQYLFVPHAVRTVRVRLRGDSCNGSAQVSVFLSWVYDVNGSTLDQPRHRLAVERPLSDQWATLVFTGGFGTGGFRLRMSYANNTRTDLCDRNVRWDFAELSWS